MNWRTLLGGHRESRQGNPHPGSLPGARPHDATGASGAFSFGAFAAAVREAEHTCDSGAGAGLSIERRDSEILAWRGWALVSYWGAEELTGRAIRPDGLRLHSLAVAYPWHGPLAVTEPPVTGPELDAVQLRQAAQFALLPPSMLMMQGPQAGYGLHACKAEAFGGTFYARCAVVGLVALSGRVIEHEQGYRAERAMIRRLWLRAGLLPESAKDLRPLDVLPTLAERYACEVDFISTETPWADA